MNEYQKKLYNLIVNGNVDDVLFIEIAYMIVENLNLEDYVQNIFMDYLDDGLDGSYASNSKSIKITREKRQYTSSSHYYYFLFEILFHEIEHVKQDKLIDECFSYLHHKDEVVDEFNSNTISEKECEKALIYILENKIIAYFRDIYNSQHNLFAIEHEARYNGCLNAHMFLKHILKEQYIFNDFEIYVDIKNRLLYGYEYNSKDNKLNIQLNSLIESLIFMNPESNKKQYEDILSRLSIYENKKSYLEPYERIKLGLPISPEEYSLFLKQKMSDIVETEYQKSIKF